MMGFITKLSGWMAVIVIAILAALGGFLKGFKPIKMAAWVGVVVVAAIAAWNEIKG